MMTENWTKCVHCGYIHDGVCPRIKSIEYYENGMTKKIEYHGPNEPQQMPQYDDEVHDGVLPF